MNRKRKFVTDAPNPEYIYEVWIQRGQNGTTKSHQLLRGMLISVNPRKGLIAGQWEFRYAERINGELRLHIEGPISREARHVMIREADIKTIHVGSKRRAR